VLHDIINNRHAHFPPSKRRPHGLIASPPRLAAMLVRSSLLRHSGKSVNEFEGPLLLSPNSKPHTKLARGLAAQARASTWPIGLAFSRHRRSPRSRMEYKQMIVDSAAKDICSFELFHRHSGISQAFDAAFWPDPGRFTGRRSKQENFDKRHLRAQSWKGNFGAAASGASARSSKLARVRSRRPG